jgi:REP element-mobilizing transposase RayT
MIARRVVLDARRREIVGSTIRRHAELRNWRLLALNVRSNHVHVVVFCPDGSPPERAMEQFKAWSTRRLRETGLVGPEHRVWTEHGSTRWINSDSSLSAAIDYVLNHQ